MSEEEDSILEQYDLCISLLKQHTNQNYFIGVMRKTLKEFKEHYTKGKIVVYKKNKNLETLTIEIPLDSAKMRENNSKKKYEFTERKLINVPKSYVEKLNLGLINSMN